jgi:hypothetical protein
MACTRLGSAFTVYHSIIPFIPPTCQEQLQILQGIIEYIAIP